MSICTYDEGDVPKSEYSRYQDREEAPAKRPRRAKKDRGVRNAAERRNSLGLTEDVSSSKVRTALTDGRQSVATRLLNPLLAEKTVYLAVDDRRLPKKTREYRPVLVLVPGRAFGMTTRTLLASFPPYGAELLRVPRDLKASCFVRLGLTFSLAKAISVALTNLYEGERHAKTK